MKRRLILMRHASAAAAGSGTDHARGLTAPGIREAREMGVRLRQLEIEPDRVLGSSAIRCRQTWDATRIGLDTSPLVDFDDALYNASARDLQRGIELVDDCESLLLIAHNPGVSMLALDLGSGRPGDEASLRPSFAPATLAVFEIDSEWSNLSRRTAKWLHMERPSS